MKIFRSVAVDAGNFCHRVLVGFMVLTLGGLLLQSAAPAHADTIPPNPNDPKTPVTASVDPLPTVQIDGVAWTQRVVGNTVYVGGSFTTARPAGAAPGTQTVPRANLLAYDIRTGNLITSFTAGTDGPVQTIVPSPDGTRLYLGGEFNQIIDVNGVRSTQTRNRIAAVNPTTGAVIAGWNPNPDATVYAILPTADTVYFGGLLTAVGGVQRLRTAAVRTSDGALLNWSPQAAGGRVRALAMSPDGQKIVIGGAFTTMNGSANPGYGLAAVPASGDGRTNLPLPANSLVRDAGAKSSITALNPVGDSLYVSGFVYGEGGNLEGIAKLDWNTLSIQWIEDCHGDTYGAFQQRGVVYVSTHAHYCGNVPDGFPQTTPWTFHFGTAFTAAATGTLGKEPYTYFNFQGTPAPSQVKWLPSLTPGTFTGQKQAGWNVTGNNDYVTIGGEFPKAGNVNQQGLVRYAVPTIAPNKVGPEYNQSKFNPTLTSFARGTVRISWRANWDRDNEKLTYSVIRNNDIAHPVYTTDLLSSEWNRPIMSYTDNGLVPGQEYRYRVFAKDPYGNEVRSDTVTITVATDGATSPYVQRVLADQPGDFWRLGESSGTTAADWSGVNKATIGTGVTWGAAGAIAGDTNTAATFDGTTNGRAASNTSEDAPQTFSTEAWFKTSSTRGGKILGFGSSATGNSTSYDRHIYLSNSGQLTYGVYPGSAKTLTAPGPYNDGKWHQVVATLGSGGMALYVDGAKVASRTDVTRAQEYAGFWRIGGDTIGTWPNQGTSAYLSGTIDDVSIYPTALSDQQVNLHYLAATGGNLPNVAPTAAFTFDVNKLAVGFDGSGSVDSDGSIASYAWDFGDGSSSTVAKPDHSYAAAGTYQVKLKVTDNQGATNEITKPVIVVANVAPTANFSAAVSDLKVGFDGSGSVDSDGSIASYAWDFGDGGSSTTAKPDHTYAAPGDYQVKLTVTDNDGATGSVTKKITAVAPAGPLATDAFGRTASNGWGNADTGGSWTRYGTASLFSVGAGVGEIRLTAAGSGPRIALESVSSNDTDATVKVSLDKLANGGGAYVSLGARAIGTNDYRTKVKVSPTGVLTLYLVRVVSGVETTLTSTALGSAFNLAAGEVLQIRVQAVGTSPTTIRAKVWKVGQTEPTAWQLTTTDSTSGLQASGGVGIATYLTATATNQPIAMRFDDLVAKASN